MRKKRRHIVSNLQHYRMSIRRNELSNLIQGRPLKYSRRNARK